MSIWRHGDCLFWTGEVCSIIFWIEFLLFSNIYCDNILFYIYVCQVCYAYVSLWNPVAPSPCPWLNIVLLHMHSWHVQAFPKLMCRRRRVVSKSHSSFHLLFFCLHRLCRGLLCLDHLYHLLLLAFVCLLSKDKNNSVWCKKCGKLS